MGEVSMLVEWMRGSAERLHGRDLDDRGGRRLWVLDPTAPAVVLGSTQSDDAVDRDAARRAGVDVVRRRSGGGAVWVSPGDPIWIDIVVPRDRSLVGRRRRAGLPPHRPRRGRSPSPPSVSGTRPCIPDPWCGPRGRTRSASPARDRARSSAAGARWSASASAGPAPAPASSAPCPSCGTPNRCGSSCGRARPGRPRRLRGRRRSDRRRGPRRRPRRRVRHRPGLTGAVGTTT